MPSHWPFLGNEAFGATARSLLTRGLWPAAAILTGPRGVGKSQIARWVVQADLCPSGQNGSPCLTCAVCQQVKAGAHQDVVVLDGAEGAISIDAVRAAVQRFALRSNHTRWLLCLDADCLTEAAANALLKTLEEPHQAVAIFLTSSKPGRLPATILSRCAFFRLHRLPLASVPAAQRAMAARSAGRPAQMRLWTAADQERDTRLANDFLRAINQQVVPQKTDDELERAMQVEEEIVRELLWRKAGQRTAAWSELDDQLDQVSTHMPFERLLQYADYYAERHAFLGAHVSLRHVYEDLHHL